MNFDDLRKELILLAQAQDEFTAQGWERIKSVQKPEKSNSLAYGTLFVKDGKEFFLNLVTVPKALKILL
jgi:hypothetical protein